MDDPYESDCEATSGRPCWQCMTVARNRLNALAHNLAIAGALCRAFELGRDIQHALTETDSQGTFRERIKARDEIHRDFFWSGCGRSAP